MHNIICTICARGGSKGVLGKNIRPIAGLPLIAHSIKQAKATELFEAIAVSTDDADIANVAKEHGADFIIERPKDMAGDTAAKIPAIRHAMLSAEDNLAKKCTILVDIDATSPLRVPQDIIHSVNMLIEKNCSNVITACPSHRSPYFNMVERGPDGAVRLVKKMEENVVRRQDAPDCYDMNASIYVWKRDVLADNPRLFYDDTQLYLMPVERSYDIDSELDFDIVEFLMERNEHANE